MHYIFDVRTISYLTYHDGYSMHLNIHIRSKIKQSSIQVGRGKCLKVTAVTETGYVHAEVKACGHTTARCKSCDLYHCRVKMTVKKNQRKDREKTFIVG